MDSAALDWEMAATRSASWQLRIPRWSMVAPWWPRQFEVTSIWCHIPCGLCGFRSTFIRTSLVKSLVRHLATQVVLLRQQFCSSKLIEYLRFCITSLRARYHMVSRYRMLSRHGAGEAKLLKGLARETSRQFEQQNWDCLASGVCPKIRDAPKVIIN